MTPPRRPGRVPVLLQSSTADCGAAALAMICAAWRRPERIHIIREQLGTGRGGASLAVLRETAEHFGLTASSVRIGHMADLRTQTLPLILHWESKHFVVLVKLTDTEAIIHDPATGRRVIPVAELEAAWHTRVALLLTPGPRWEPRRLASPSRQYLKQLFVEQKRLWLLLGAITAISTASGVTMSLMLERVLDTAATGHWPGLLLALTVGVVLVRLGATWGRAHAVAVLNRWLERAWVRPLVQRLLSLSWHETQLRTPMDLLQRLQSANLIVQAVTSKVPSTVLDTLLITVYTVVLGVRAPGVAALALTAGALLGLLSWRQGQLMDPLQTRLIGLDVERDRRLLETLRGLSLLRPGGVVPQALANWDRVATDARTMRFTQQRLEALFGAARSMLGMVVPVIVLALGAWALQQGKTSAGAVVANLLLAQALVQPMATLVEVIAQWPLLRLHLSRLDEIWAAPVDPGAADRLFTPAEGVAPPHVASEPLWLLATPPSITDGPQLPLPLSLEHLSLRYVPREPLVLDDISLVIQPHEHVVIVGPSGSGKSSLSTVLLGLMPPSGGSIRLGDRPMHTWPEGDRAQQIQRVGQDPFIMQGSIAENLRLLRPDASEADLWAALEATALADEVRAMPGGLTSHLSEGGGSLSGGQRQRLALARVWLTDAPILILDEATSQLDATSEAAIQQQINRLSSTRIVIAHRLSAATHADRVLVLDGGKLVQHGPHAQLVQVPGPYRTLWEAHEGTNRALSAPPERHRIRPDARVSRLSSDDLARDGSSE